MPCRIFFAEPEGLETFVDQGQESSSPSPMAARIFLGLIDCFGFNGPLRQYFSLYRDVSQRDREKEEKKDRGE